MKTMLTIMALLCTLSCAHKATDARKPASDGSVAKKEFFEEMLRRVKADDRPKDSENGKWPPYFVKNEEVSNKKLKKALTLMIADLPEETLRFQELERALLLNFVSPVQDHYTVSEAAKLAFKDVFSHPFLKGKDPGKAVGVELWEDTGDISKKSLKLGFNRTEHPLSADQVCDYAEPKTGYGTRPGFTMNCNGKKIKIKFKEVHAEAFTTRIFWALGFHVEPVDYMPSVRVRYDRRIIDEFNSRKKMMLKVTLLGKTIMNKPYAKQFNAVDFFDHLVMKDGSIVPHEKIEQTLKDKENQVAEVVTVPAQIQESNDALVKVGPWSFNELDHPDRMEMRALVVLAAWLNWYDVRFDNNRVVIEDDSNGKPQMKLYIGDVGSAMGNVSKLIHFISSKIENPELFSDRFTKNVRGDFKIKNYFHLVDENKAFRQASADDARWIARLMLQLKPEQVREALVASGFTPEETEIFEQKLFKRLEYMKADLGL